MADILRGYGLAREQAHFKLEQEADVQRRRQRLIKEGKLPSKEDAKKGSAEAEREAGPAPGFNDSLQDFEVCWGWGRGCLAGRHQAPLQCAWRARAAQQQRSPRCGCLEGRSGHL